MTVLTLLQEVAQVKESKIDWNELVKKTTTGITNAREYQMVWRHLAYRKVLLDQLDAAAQPLDDDSDLEYELEAFPPVSNEASAEVAACVKRRATIRKRHGNMVGNGSQLSEAQLAARHAMSMALGNNSRAACPISTTAGPNSGGGPSNSSHFAAADIASGGPQSKHLQDLVPSKPIIPKNPLPKPAINPDPTAKAAAMAASSRIATHSSAAASLQRAAQSKKVVHIMPGGPPAIKPSVPGSFNGLPSNVHFIRTGLVAHPAGPSNSSQSGTQQLQAVRSASPAGQPKPATVPSRTNASSAVPSAPTSSPATVLEVNSKASVPTAVLSNARSEKLLANTPQRQVQKDQTFGSGNLLTGKGEGQTSVLGDIVKELGGVSKASRIRVQEKLIPSQETPSIKNENTKIELAVENAGVQGPAPVTCKVVFKDS